jgi:hypothetical protein
MRGFLLIIGFASLLGQSPEGPAVTNLGPATLAGEIPASRVSDSGKQGDWPAVAAAEDGSVWTAWIEWNDKDADRLLVRRRDAQGKYA